MENDLEELLQQGCGSTPRARERLNQLETRKEKRNFTGRMIETHVFKLRTNHFRGLNVSSRMGMKRGGGRRFRHAISFPAELMKGTRARGVEQELVCIYIHSPCIFQDAHNSSVLNNDVVGAFLQSQHVAGLSRPVKIQFWHDMVLRLRDNTTRIHVHLLTALLLLNCSFLLSTLMATSTMGLCQVTSALLHASLLCALAWMAAEAFHLLLLLVKVYNIYIQHYLLKLCFFSWGLPMLAVAAVFVFKRDTYGYHTISTSEGYRNATICWLTSPPAHYATVCYAGLILLFNTLVLGRVGMILRRIRQQNGQARKDWATVLGLTCLLGTTWGLGFFSFGVFLVPQLYLFTILNSLQGVGASSHRAEDFRFCGDRNQTQNSSVVYEHGPATISIKNTAQALIIKRPFLPNETNSYYTYSLPPALGRYRFCVYWFKANRTLRLAYGKQSFILGGDPSSSITRGKEHQKTERTSTSIFNVSYISKGGKNTSLESASEYFFPCGGNYFNEMKGSFHPQLILAMSKALVVVSQYMVQHNDVKTQLKASPESMPICEEDVEEQLTTLDSLLAQPLALAAGATEQQMLRRKLGELEKTLAKVELEGQNQTFGKATVHVTVLRVQPTQAPQHLAFASQREEGREVHGFTVDLPSSLFMVAKEREDVVEHRVLLMDINSQTMFQDENSSRVLGDKVVGISLVDTVVANLSHPVVLTLFHNLLPRNVTPLCVFWQEDTTGSTGSWDSYGCTTVTGSSQTDCRCNHLTYFAVLMVSSPEITYIHRDYLSIITYIGCLISALASICTIFFLYFRSKQRDQITSMHIHMNLLGAIFLLDVSFLISEHLASSSSEAFCRAGGLFLHFSLLSCLTWMGIEGYNLYRLVIEVFNAYHDHFLLKLCLVGWGLPFFCVTLIFLASWTNYGPFSIPIYESVGGKSTNATICWITSPLIHNVVNLGFFSLVFLFNSVMLGAMVREILRQNKKGHKLKHVLALFGLSILLGIPWALVFFSFTSGVFRLVSLYIFTIINSLQGFLIFLWYWTMVLQARKSPDSQSSSDSVKLQPNSSQSHLG
ncbi:g-protein coupled receptor 56 [Limosa lapponica baueri]|uniref:Adhesion G-protein coupled receptor G1 n=1 Tax=Limosa lapponica baueri TaxID=1758121 RepID=A0A2I0U8P2_LIMLA|nr:g-protein coupled receptor 56 [Limosa lapponica baueri]